VRDEQGNRVAYAAAFHSSESVLTQLVDAHQYPELVDVRETLRQMRFHHNLRTDDEAPARQSSLGTRTDAVSDDGSDLAAALATIQRAGDRQGLRRCIDEAFDGATLDVIEDDSDRLDLVLHSKAMMRPLTARELSDGQLRYLFLAAALLSPRPPVVVILNEPESSLHVDLLSALAELVAAASERTQIVLTTHALSLAESLLEHDGTLGLELRLHGGSTSVAKM
jgi:predicted ATPase